jgi:hypothetical protein
VIRIDAAWLAVEPMDMRAGPDTALARVVGLWRAAAPCLCVCQCPRHPDEGVGPRRRRPVAGGPASARWQVQLGFQPQPSLPISTTQLGALVLGLPWQRVGHTGAITLV